ncbi:MAG: orotidine-5'-phosphate decarboxylase [Dehalococcoidia bacterium]
MTSFSERLDQACEANRSLLCVGLDVDPERMPVADPLEFNRAIVDATAGLVCAYKPNLAFYEALGLPGLKALEGTVQYIRLNAPSVVIVGDAKRGDIGPSGAAYARAMFQVWDFDIVTVNAWGGHDTVEPFLEDPDRGVFIWCRGSNPGSADLQDLNVDGPEGVGPLYNHLARSAASWNQRGNVGLVMGATNPQQLADVRHLCPDMPLLIPGVGAQGGDLEEAVRLGTDEHGRRALINSSRGIIYASNGQDFAQAAGRAAASLRDSINGILEALGKGWR